MNSRVVILSVLLFGTPVAAVGFHYYPLSPIPTSDPVVLVVIGLGLLGLAGWVRRQQ